MRPLRMPRAGATLLTACTAALACAAVRAPAAAQRRPGDTVEVLSVSFRGADQLPVPLLRTAIETTATRCVSVALQPLCWMGTSLDRRYLDPRALAADVFRLRVFYYQRGFRDARIELDTTRTAAGMHVRFRIDEGPPVTVRSLAVEGADGFDGALTRALPIRPGRPFSLIAFEAARDTLTTRLANRGHAGAWVLANYDIPADGHAVDVVFLLDPGRPTRFGAIEVAGLDRVSADLVTRMLTFREGDSYSRQALLRSQRNLFGLEVFRHAEISTPRATETDSVLPVRVQVNEGDMHRVRIGIGMSTTDYLNAEGRWVARNFMDGGRRLELRGRVTNMVAEPLRYVRPPFENCADIYCDVAGSLGVDFSQPWFFGPQNSVGAGAFLERFTVPGVYVRSSHGAYLSLRRSMPRNTTVTGTFRRERTRLESDGDIIFCVSFVACEASEIDLLREAHWLSPFALSFSMDRSNSLVAPTRGYIVRADTELASALTASDFSYARVLGEVSAYREPFRGVVVATRLRPGWARAGASAAGPGLHPQKRFFAGGPNSVRGFAQYRLGPKLLTISDARTLVLPAVPGGSPGAGCTPQQVNAGTCDLTDFVAAYPDELQQQPVGGSVSLEGNVEVRFPIWAGRLRGATFLDFGQVWRHRHEVQARDVRFTPGAGLRYFSPIGPVRFDVGYNPGRTERLVVMTTELCDARVTPCGAIEPGIVYQPADLDVSRTLRTLPAVTWRPYDSFLDRLQFHFSIGQAF
jgi:outer membrane protein assembly factor BamA